MEMRTIGFVALVVLVNNAACANDAPCSKSVLEINPASPGTVFQNQVTCTGNVNARNTCVLTFPAEAHVVQAPCSLEIRLGKGGYLSGSLVVLFLEFDGDEITSASAELRSYSDEEADEETHIPVEGGWITPDVSSSDGTGRNAGQFSLTFADGVVEGSYDTTGIVASRWWVVSEFDVADTPQDAIDVAFNLDSGALPDNSLGRFLASIPYHQAGVADGVASGAIIQLLSIPERVSFVAQTIVPLRGSIGADADDPPDPSDNLSGTEQFTISRNGRTDRYVPGSVSGGRFNGGPGEMTVRLTLSHHGSPIDLPLVGVKIRTGLTATALFDGLAGGAVLDEDIQAVLVPGIHKSFSASVTADCSGGVCVPNSAGEHILATYDADGNGEISLAELIANGAFQTALAPDVDLFDAEGTFNPNTDGVKDSLSLGFRFTAVRARLLQ